jgi:hypothetical protein
MIFLTSLDDIGEAKAMPVPLAVPAKDFDVLELLLLRPLSAH